MNPVDGAILCGGASSRMGRPKALCLLHDGNTALFHVAAAMRQAGLRRVVAVGGAQGPAAEALLSPQVDAVLLDGGGHGHHGPLWGVHAALRETRGRTVFWPVDMPRVCPSILRELATHPAAAVHLPGEPLCAALDAEMLPSVDEQLARGHAGVRALMRLLHAARVRPGRLLALDPASNWSLAFNTPGQLEHLNARARECAMTPGAP
jgi:molybdopterin-guanine dinucleotide biosynthesis protein A